MDQNSSRLESVREYNASSRCFAIKVFLINPALFTELTLLVHNPSVLFKSSFIQEKISFPMVSFLSTKVFSCYHRLLCRDILHCTCDCFGSLCIRYVNSVELCEKRLVAAGERPSRVHQRHVEGACSFFTQRLGGMLLKSQKSGITPLITWFGSIEKHHWWKRLISLQILFLNFWVVMKF